MVRLQQGQVIKTEWNGQWYVWHKMDIFGQGDNKGFLNIMVTLAWALPNSHFLCYCLILKGLTKLHTLLMDMPDKFKNSNWTCHKHLWINQSIKNKKIMWICEAQIFRIFWLFSSFKVLNVIVHILKSMQILTGTQCNWFSISTEWYYSETLVTTPAKQFCTCCNLTMPFSGMLWTVRELLTCYWPVLQIVFGKSWGYTFLNATQAGHRYDRSQAK